MQSPSWKNHPALKTMDSQKLKWLETLAEQTAKQKPDNILPFLLAANANAQRQGIRFSDAETDVILCVLEENMNPQEKKKVESIRKLMTGLNFPA